MSKNRTGALVAIVTLAIQASLFFGPWSMIIGAESTSFAPDPIAVQRHGPAWKYPQAGWLVVHIEGEPYERGYQHGRLLAREIVDDMKSLARTRSRKDPEAAWKALRIANRDIPLKADRDVTDDDLKSHHLLVVGEPLTNSLLLRAAEKSPVRFGNQSFSVRGEMFADHDSAVIVASENPWNSRFSVVAFAGLSARATHRIVDSLSPDEELSPQVVVFPAHRVPQRFVVR